MYLSKQHRFFFTSLAICAFLLSLNSCKTKEQSATDERAAYEQELRNHPFYSANGNTTEEEREETPEEAWKQDYLRTMDPSTGKPSPEKLFSILESMPVYRKGKNLPGDSGNEWEEHGPNDVGGRTRAIMFDPNDPQYKKVWAGGVTGGLWFTNDYSNVDSPWYNVSEFWDNMAITGITYDPLNQNTFYVCTGEGWYLSTSGAPGAGVWKSTDGGKKWSHITSTSDYHYINDMVVRPENGVGVLYIGVDYSTQFDVRIAQSAISGLYKSTDGGSSFTRLLNNSTAFGVSDLELGPDNTLWIGTRFSNGQILKSTDGQNFTDVFNYTNATRVEIAVAPSDPNVVYCAEVVSGDVANMSYTTDGGATWNTMNEPIDDAHKSDDFSRGQAWYDLILAVDPLDKSTVYVGTVDWFKSTNYGDSWQQISIWTNSSKFPFVHADQHAFVFRPNKGGKNNTEVLIGNDGGIFYSQDITQNPPTFKVRNHLYNVTQYYAAAMHPGNGTYYFLAGSQDNGTHKFTQSGINDNNKATGGDGAFCFIDQDEPDIQISSYTYNTFYISTNGGGSFKTLNNDGKSGYFINPADYDSKFNTLYSSFDENAIQRIASVNSGPSKSNISIDLKSRATHLRVVNSTNHTNLYVGTLSGRLFKIVNAESPSSYTIQELTSTKFPSASISCIDFGKNENEILLTFSNYGVTLKSVWYSANGGKNWSIKEGDLPDMPVRWCRFNPLDSNQALLATEIGVWATVNFHDAEPNWAPVNGGFGNVRVDQIHYRKSDYLMIAATHGRGLFSSYGLRNSVPVGFAISASTKSCPGTEIVLTASFGGQKPMTYQWYKNGQILKVPTTNTLVINLSANDTGFYHCGAMNEFGSGATKRTHVEMFHMPKPDLGPDLHIRPEVTFELTPGAGYRTYIWNKSSFAEVLKLKGSDLGDGNHLISCKVYSFDFCEATDTVMVNVSPTASVGASPENALQVFPNPAKQSIHIKCDALWLDGKSTVEIYNYSGQLLHKGILSTSAIDINAFPKGNYIIRAGRNGELMQGSFRKL